MRVFHIWYDSSVTAYLDQISGHVNMDYHILHYGIRSFGFLACWD